MSVRFQLSRRQSSPINNLHSRKPFSKVSSLDYNPPLKQHDAKEVTRSLSMYDITPEVVSKDLCFYEMEEGVSFEEARWRDSQLQRPVSGGGSVVDRPIRIVQKVDQSQFRVENVLAGFQKNCSTVTNISPTARLLKGRSIHTVNESQPFASSPPSPPQQLQQKRSFFATDNWFLQENLSDQFGYNSTLHEVSPVFEKGNFYAEYFNCPTVPPKLFGAMEVKPEPPTMRLRKDFKNLSLPYIRQNRGTKRVFKSCP